MIITLDLTPEKIMMYIPSLRKIINPDMFYLDVWQIIFDWLKGGGGDN